MKTETKKVEPVDCIFHNAEIKFSFWDRVKILFGATTRYRAEMHTDVVVNVLKTEASIYVDRLIPRKSKDGMVANSEVVAKDSNSLNEQ